MSQRLGSLLPGPDHHGLECRSVAGCSATIRSQTAPQPSSRTSQHSHTEMKVIIMVIVVMRTIMMIWGGWAPPIPTGPHRSPPPVDGALCPVFPRFRSVWVRGMWPGRGLLHWWQRRAMNCRAGRRCVLLSRCRPRLGDPATFDLCAVQSPGAFPWTGSWLHPGPARF